MAGSKPPRDVPGALHGSRLVTLPHVAPEVAAFGAFIGGDVPVLVEVGFDHGRRLHSTARLNPCWRVVGLEVRKQRVAEANARAMRDGLTNVYPWRMDARTVFAGVLDEDSVDVVEVLFPTPWWNPALRQKRLLIDGPFLADLARVLRPGGLFHVATDVPEYADHIARCLDGHPDLNPLDEEAGARRRPPCDQLSRREWKCDREGLRIYRTYLERA